MIYPSKKDWWLGAIIWGTVIITLGSGGLAVFTKATSTVEYLLVTLLTIPPSLFIAWVWLTTYYVLEKEHLFVHSGPIRRTIPLDSIRSVRPSRNPLSSPALSMDRLEIAYGRNKYVLISPLDRDEFLRQLEARLPEGKNVIRNR